MFLETLLPWHDGGRLKNFYGTDFFRVLEELMWSTLFNWLPLPVSGGEVDGGDGEDWLIRFPHPTPPRLYYLNFDWQSPPNSYWTAINSHVLLTGPSRRWDTKSELQVCSISDIFKYVFSGATFWDNSDNLGLGEEYCKVIYCQMAFELREMCVFSSASLTLIF